MREIKFRAWDNDVMLYNVWPVGDKLYDTNGGFWRSLRNPLMQYTGLKDKNGKEIYESDRLKDSSGYTWIVFWYNDHACFGVRSEVNSAGSEIIDNVNMEVVGNIYENNSQGK